eukprot:9783257-Alexandrium_andersonii.AAC.2
MRRVCAYVPPSSNPRTARRHRCVVAWERGPRNRQQDACPKRNAPRANNTHAAHARRLQRYATR